MIQKRSEKYANEIIDNLIIDQLTIKDLKQIIAKAWEDGYNKAKKKGTTSNNTPAHDSVSIDDSPYIIPEEDDILKINTEPWRSDSPFIWPHPDYPYSPHMPGVHYPGAPWLPIVYC